MYACMFNMYIKLPCMLDVRLQIVEINLTSKTYQFVKSCITFYSTEFRTIHHLLNIIYSFRHSQCKNSNLIRILKT